MRPKTPQFWWRHAASPHLSNWSLFRLTQCDLTPGYSVSYSSCFQVNCWNVVFRFAFLQAHYCFPLVDQLVILRQLRLAIECFLVPWVTRKEALAFTPRLLIFHSSIDVFCTCRVDRIAHFFSVKASTGRQLLCLWHSSRLQFFVVPYDPDRNRISLRAFSKSCFGCCFRC